METKISDIKKLVLLISLYLFFFDINNIYLNYLIYKENAEACVDEDGNKVNLQIGSIHSCYRAEIDKRVPSPFVIRIADEIYNVEKLTGLYRGGAVDIIQIRRDYKKYDTNGYEIYIGTKSFLPMEKIRVVICPSEYSFECCQDTLSESIKGLVDHEVFHAIDDHFGILSRNPIWAKQFKRISRKNNYSKNSIFSFVDKVLDDNVAVIQCNKNAAEFFAAFVGTLYSETWESRISKSWYSFRNKDDYRSTLYALREIVGSKKVLNNSDFSQLIKKRIKFLGRIKNQSSNIKKVKNLTI